MDVEERFILIAGLLCEPTRARMLWNLLDGRAYTATELAVAADVSTTSASNHLAKLLEADLLKVENQGRHRYYSFATSEVAYVVESLANLAKDGSLERSQPTVSNSNGIKYCRTCYDHLAGFVGVTIVDAFEQKGFLKPTQTAYSITERGWKWFEEIGIFQDDLARKRRPLTRQCLDWSERRPHLAGQLGAKLLEETLNRKWFVKIQFSRELVVTPKGRKELLDLLEIKLQ
jgi:DNA-binding transcriptional ArsR family regulator